MSNYNVKDEKSLAELEKHLQENQYIGGTTPNAQDAFTFEAFNHEVIDATKYPAIAGWAHLVRYFFVVMESWKVEEKKETAPAKGGKGKKGDKKQEKKEDDEDVDLFGEDDGDDDAIQKEKEELKKKKDEDAKKKKKAGPIAKSLILIDVKVFELEQDLVALAHKIMKEICPPGIVWKEEFKTPEVAFGMKKLVLGCVVEDEVCSIDDINDAILDKYADEVQSIDIACFNKI